MAKTSYYTVANEIIAERATGAPRREYAPDALGSVVATISGNSRENQYSYKPYGSLLSKSGIGEDPCFDWVGSSGYRQTNRTNADHYVRARTISSLNARWLSKDILWPTEHPYGYATNPVTAQDPTGMGPEMGTASCNCGGLVERGTDIVTTDLDKSDPRYGCLVSVCTWYCQQKDTIASWKDQLCPITGSLIGRSAACQYTIDQYHLKPCDYINRETSTCYDAQGDDADSFANWRTSTFGLGCCLECQDRVCCHIQLPAYVKLDIQKDYKVIGCLSIQYFIPTNKSVALPTTQSEFVIPGEHAYDKHLLA